MDCPKITYQICNSGAPSAGDAVLWKVSAQGISSFVEDKRRAHLSLFVEDEMWKMKCIPYTPPV